MTSLKKQLFSGVVFTAIGRYSYIIINVLITAVLARILTPADFGVVAIATVIINFFSMLSDMGIGPAIIQNKELKNADLRSIFTLTLWMGIGLSVIFFLLAPVFSFYYDNENLLSIIQLFSISIFLHCADIVPHNLIVKSKRFSFIAYSSIIIQVICGVLSIWGAFLGMGIYALLIQPILSSIMRCVVDITQYFIMPVIKIKKTSISKIYSYSIYQFMFSFINYFSRNLDKLVVGRIFGVSELGYYEKSYRLMMLPVGNLSNIITPAIQPIFSEFQHDKKLLYHRSMKIFRIFAMMGFPLSILLFFCSKEIILITFGPQWYGAIPVFQILSVSVGFQMIFSPQGTFFQSANAVKEMFYCGIATAIFNVLSVVIGCVLFCDIKILSWLVVVSYVLAFLLTYYIMVKRVFNGSYIHFLSILKDPLILSALLIISLSFVHYFLPELKVIISFIIKCVAFAIISLVYELLTHKISNVIK
jgi:PST family polysaccharide transporter